MSKPILTAERLRELLRYDPETGVFMWLINKGRAKIGDITGCNNGDGYLRIKIDHVLYQAHRLAWLYMIGEWPKDQIDHINGDRSDNRILNLRNASHSVNQQNQKMAQRSNKSTGLLGAYRHGKGFKAMIMFDGKVRHIGTYQTPELAHAAYLDAKRTHHAGCTI